MFTKLAQMNMDHYNNHPGTHLALTALGTLGAFAVIEYAARRAALLNVNTKY